MSGWTDERVEHLKVLWDEGGSCSVIAAAIGGMTRNAVIGKVHRLGLTARAKKPAPSPAKIRHRAKFPFLGRAPKLSPPPAAETDSQPRLFLGIPLLDLKQGQCRYPQGEGRDTLFCGQATMAGSSYCPACHRRCHQTPMNEERDRRRLQSYLNSIKGKHAA